MSRASRRQPKPDTTSRADAGVPRLLLAATGLAGAASLVYEVVWVRQLSLSFGSTALAGSIVLSAFLGGMAIGSWLCSRRADSNTRPLQLLVRLEVAGAVLGVLSIPVLGFVGRGFVLATGGMQLGDVTAMGLRVLFSLIAVLLPATVFGAVFPLAMVVASRATDSGRAAGAVYAASSFGSAAGAALGGMAIEPLAGLSGAVLVGAGMNLAAALAAWMASNR